MVENAVARGSSCAPARLARPFGAHDRDPVLVEVGGNHQGRDLVEAVLAQAIEDGLALDAVIAGSEAQRRSIWRIREAIPEAIGRLGWIITHDVSVPLSRIAGFAEELEQGLVRLTPRCRLAIYGHLGDGICTFPSCRRWAAC